MSVQSNSTKNQTSQTQVFKDHYAQLKANFLNTHQEIAEWLNNNALQLEDLRTYSQQLLAAVSLAGQVVLTQPVAEQIQAQVQILENTEHEKVLSKVTQDERQEILSKMVEYVNMPPGHLDKQSQLYLEQQLTDILGFDVSAELDGHRLNHSLGIMGAEQHLKRFPTDTLEQHDAYLEAGIAPNRGAFAWFAENGQLTEKVIMMEKYYFAVQTLYLPDWNTNYKELKPWYKFRKMIMINPAEELAVVGVVADAGPAMWIKKQFGGSPEVIREAKVWSPKARGRVILYFVDDPENKVPLGLINLTTQNDLNEINE